MKLGEKYTKMNWLDSLKIAIIQKDSDKAFELTQNLPQFESLEDMLEAQELISQVITLLEEDKEETKKQMQQIKAAKKFLES